MEEKRRRKNENIPIKNQKIDFVFLSSPLFPTHTMENITADAILKKLQTLDEKIVWKNWTQEEERQLLQMYWIISKHESHIFQLIYDHSGSDTYEDIFRDYDRHYLKDKVDGVKEAIDYMDERSKKT